MCMYTHIASVYDNVVIGPTNQPVESRLKPTISASTSQHLETVARTLVPCVTSYPVVDMYTGVRPATAVKDYCITSDTDR